MKTSMSSCFINNSKTWENISLVLFTLFPVMTGLITVDGLAQTVSFCARLCVYGITPIPYKECVIVIFQERWHI